MSTTVSAPQPKKSLPCRLFAWVRRHIVLCIIAVGGAGVGFAGFATWITVIEHTNHTEFCLNCHVMRDTVYEEYKKSSHYTNKFGVRVGCPDCHVPQYSWIDEAMAKVGTLKELYAFAFQGMSKVENFSQQREALAQEVWHKFEESNARECKHCHSYSNMIASEQAPSARAMHADAGAKDANCVECHKGITHKNFAKKEDAPAPTDFDVQ